MQLVGIPGQVVVKQTIKAGKRQGSRVKTWDAIYYLGLFSDH